MGAQSDRPVEQLGRAEQGFPVKQVYQAPRLVRVGSFAQVTQELSTLAGLGQALVLDWSHGRVS